MSPSANPYVIKTADRRYLRIDQSGVSLVQSLAEATLNPPLTGYVVGQRKELVEVVVMEAAR